MAARRPSRAKGALSCSSPFSRASPSAPCLLTGALAQATDTADPAAPTTAPGEPATGLGAPAPAPVELSGDWVVDEGWRPADMAAVTADQMIGADIRNADGQVIASVDDLILSADGKAESIAATFGGFLGFGTESVVARPRRGRDPAERRRPGHPAHRADPGGARRPRSARRLRAARCIGPPRARAAGRPTQVQAALPADLIFPSVSVPDHPGTRADGVPPRRRDTKIAAPPPSRLPYRDVSVIP